MNNNWNYYGVFFDDSAKRFLLNEAKKYITIPEDWTNYCHHMTIVYNNGTEEAQAVAEKYEPIVFNTAKLKVEKIGVSDRAVAFGVSTDLDIVNKLPHVTIAVAPGAKPVESNYITNWKDITPFYVEGTIQRTKKLREKKI